MQPVVNGKSLPLGIPVNTPSTKRLTSASSTIIDLLAPIIPPRNHSFITGFAVTVPVNKGLIKTNVTVNAIFSMIPLVISKTIFAC
jgi:hypothetical protein